MKSSEKLNNEINIARKLTPEPECDILKRRRDYPYFGFCGVSTGFGDDFTLFCANDCPISLALIHKGVLFDEPNSAGLWANFSKRSRVILDVGAHIGFFSLLAESVNNQSKIYAFEPSPIVYSRLVVNANANRSKSINSVFSAVSDKMGRAEIHFSANATYLSTAGTLEAEYKKFDSVSVGVQSTTLDVFLEAHKQIHNIDLIKIDVEHHELAVLKGALQTLTHSNPIIFIELLLESEFIAARDFLKNLGFYSYKINDLITDLSSSLNLIQNFDNSTGRNYLFARNKSLFAPQIFLSKLD
jgi:FkbM family methyltransferase